MPDEKPRVLFLCTGNSARSQMAEAILRRHADDRFEACSAGLRPRSEIHPLTLRVLNEVGLDTEGLCTKAVEIYLAKVPVQHAVIVCEKAQESCPRIYPFAMETLYWPFEDPAAFEGSEEERLEKFRDVRDAIDERITTWLDTEA
jgi:arsenate reductase